MFLTEVLNFVLKFGGNVLSRENQLNISRPLQDERTQGLRTMFQTLYDSMLFQELSNFSFYRKELSFDIYVLLLCH